MSRQADLTAEAASVHDDWFGDAYEYRPHSEADWEPITGRRMADRIESKKTQTGWTRVAVVDVTVALSAITQPILYAQLRLADSEEIMTVTEFRKLPSSRWMLTCQLTRAGEISRPNLRR